MRTKKRLEIKTFNNFSNTNNPIVNTFYNYKNSAKLKASNGIDVPHLAYHKTDSREYTLKLDDAGIEKVEGINYVKQYFPDSKKTVYRLLIYANDGKLYFNQLLNYGGAVFDLYGLQFANPPSVLSYKNEDTDITILTDKEKMVFWKLNYLPYEVANLPIVTSICLNDGYIYCTLEDPSYKIWFSQSKNVELVGTTNAYSGYISLEDELGDARKVVVLDKEVYIFRDFGISKLTQVKGKIEIKNVYSSGCRIYPDTVSVSGSEVLFLTQEGLYLFNGYRALKRDLNFENLKLLAQNAVGCCLGDKYYLAVRIDYKDDKKVLCENGEYINNTLLIIDVNNSSYQMLRGVDIKSFLPLKTDVYEKVLMVFNTGANGIGEIVEDSIFFDSELPKYWESEELFYSSETKLFTKLTAIADAGVKIKLNIDGNETTFTTYNKGTNEFAFKKHGKQIKVEISSNEKQANVDSICLDYYVY